MFEPLKFYSVFLSDSENTEKSSSASEMEQSDIEVEKGKKKKRGTRRGRQSSRIKNYKGENL